MQKDAMTLYKGLREAVQGKCTVQQMMDPKIHIDKHARGSGFKVSRPMVDQVKVVIRAEGMWMEVSITVLKEVIRSVMAVIKDWCAATLGATELDEVPDWDNEALSPA